MDGSNEQQGALLEHSPSRFSLSRNNETLKASFFYPGSSTENSKTSPREDPLFARVAVCAGLGGASLCSGLGLAFSTFQLSHHHCEHPSASLTLLLSLQTLTRAPHLGWEPQLCCLDLGQALSLGQGQYPNLDSDCSAWTPNLGCLPKGTRG